MAIWQGYEQLALYEDIMIPPARVKEFLRTAVSPEERDYDEIPVSDLAACEYDPKYFIPCLLHELMTGYQPQTSYCQRNNRATRTSWNNT